MKLYLLIILATPLFIHPFSYDSAIYAAQKGDMQRADEQLKKMVVDTPDKADVLYDSGVVTHGLKNTTQAAAYFARAAECAQDDKNLCVRAHFNAGNACVDNKDLKCALEHYDKALVLEPDNEYVRHNRDRVAQMLQEQEQQKDQQQDKDEKDDQKKDQDDEKEDDQQQNEQQDGNDQSDGEQDQQKQEGNDQQQNGNGQQQKQKNNSSDNKSDKNSDQQSQEEQGDDSKAGDKDAQRKQQRDREKKNSQSADQKKGDSKDDLEKGSQDAKAEGDKKERQQHGKTPEQENKEDKKSIAAGEGQEQGAAEQENIPQQFGKKIDDPWLASILDDQELRDKAINKQLMEAKIRQNGGKHGQNCW